METEQKRFFIIKERFLYEISEKESSDKKYFEDYRIPSIDKNIIIFDLDKRNIMPYTAFLLSSMSEFKFVKYARNWFYIILIVLFISIFLIFKWNWNNEILEKLTPILNNINNNQIINKNNISESISWSWIIIPNKKRNLMSN